MSQQADRTPEAGRIVVLSYNICHGEGADGRIDLERTAAVIRAAAPDVAMLQEVDRCTERSRGVDQARALAGLAGLHASYGASMPFQGGAYGNAILSRSPPAAAPRCVPLPGDEPRCALIVSLETAAGRFRAAATHLDLNPARQLEAAARLVPLAREDPDRPMLLAGDMNAPPGGPVLNSLERAWTRISGAGLLPTFPASAPADAIDHILCRPAGRWKAVDIRVLDAAAASDHRPLLAVLELLPPGP